MVDIGIGACLRTMQITILTLSRCLKACAYQLNMFAIYNIILRRNSLSIRIIVLVAVRLSEGTFDLIHFI